MKTSIWHALLHDRWGIDEFGQSGIPVAMCFQQMDYIFLPWLERALAQYPNISTTSGTFSHALLPLVHPAHRAWQMVHGPKHTTKVQFFPEFYIPDANSLHDEGFLVLGSQTFAYSQVHFEQNIGNTSGVEVDDDIGQHDAILYGDRVGLVMKGFEPLLAAFFNWQRDPFNSSYEENLRKAFQSIAEMDDDLIIIWPIDLEAPRVGAMRTLWKDFFGLITKYNLGQHFISLDETFVKLAPQAVQTRRPHRAIGAKWTKHEVQVEYVSRLRAFEPQDDRQHMIYALATISDVLSGLCTKIDRAKKKILVEVRDIEGHLGPLEIGYSQEVIDLAMAGRDALFEERKLHRQLLDARNGGMLTARVLQWAEKNDL